jgi:hypothetical protein
MFETLAFPGLRVGMIDLEDAQGRKWIAEGEGVEAGAEDHVLANALLEGEGQLFFRETAAYGDEKAQAVCPWIAYFLFGLGANLGGGFVAEDAEGEGIFEDERLVVKLMGSAPHRDTLSGAAAAAVHHAGTGLMNQGWA